MRARWLLVIPVVAVVAGVTWFVASPASAVPSGTHTVEVFTVDEPISTKVSPEDRPGFVGRLLGMCDADTYYVTVGDAAECLVLSGPAGEVRVSGSDKGPVLEPDQAARALAMVKTAGAEATRVVLEYDGGPVAIIDVSALDSSAPVVATPVT
jgi:hypothetical protein